MSLIETDTDYHVALNGVGIILQGAPGAPGYRVTQAPLYNARFGQGDRSYSDFSFWWFWAQTSFLGYKQDKVWEDDGFFYESEGVDVSSDNGAVRLSYKQNGTGSVAKTIIMSDGGNAGSATVLVGRNTTDAKMLAIGTDGSTIWQDTATGANEKILCSAELGDGEMYIGCKTVGSGASMLKKGSGSSFADVGTHSAGGGIYQIVPYNAGDSLYLFTLSAGIYVYSRSAGTFTQKKTSYPYGLSASALPFGSTPHGKYCWLIGDRIYFTLQEGSLKKTQLWAYDIGDDVYVLINSFEAGESPQRIIEFNGSLYLFDPGGFTYRLRVLKYNPNVGSLERLIEIGRDGGTTALVANPTKDAKGIYFVVDDGTSDYQAWRMDVDENFSSGISPPVTHSAAVDLIFVGGNGAFVWSKDGQSGVNGIAADDQLPQNDYQTLGYFKTSIFDGTIPAMDKLFNDVIINFSALRSGESIQASYSIDGGVNFVTLGTADYSVDGAISSKLFPFGNAVVSKKMMLRFRLLGDGSTTPQFNDYSVRYVPSPNCTKQWDLRINAGDDVRRLNGALVNKVARELKGLIESSWWTKSVLDFQDLDYAATQLNGSLSVSATTVTVDSTVGFPEQGRLLIDNEQILYTGLTPRTFTGCTRGARDTRAAAHSDNAVVSNAYKVIIVGMSQVTPILLEGKNLEYIIDVSLREV